MDAESVLRKFVERKRLEFRKMPLEGRNRHALDTATPWLFGARQALLALDAITEQQADEILRPWFDDLHQEGLVEYGDGGGADVGFPGFVVGEMKPEAPPT